MLLVSLLRLQSLPTGVINAERPRSGVIAPEIRSIHVSVRYVSPFRSSVTLQDSLPVQQRPDIRHGFQLSGHQHTIAVAHPTFDVLELVRMIEPARLRTIPIALALWAPDLNIVAHVFDFVGFHIDESILSSSNTSLNPHTEYPIRRWSSCISALQ